MATGAPGTNGVWQYGEDDSEATFSALLNKVASTTDTQIGTDRGRLTTLEARKISGLVPIVPTSVNLSTGTATISANGQVNTTAATTYVQLNGVFTDAYDTYAIYLDCDANATEWGNFQLCNAGTPNTSGNYWFGISYLSSAATGFSGGAAGMTYGRIGIMDTNTGSGIMEVYGTRNANINARVMSDFLNANADMKRCISNFTTTATTFDGIRIIHATSTFNHFKVQVFGVNK